VRRVAGGNVFSVTGAYTPLIVCTRRGGFMPKKRMLLVVAALAVVTGAAAAESAWTVSGTLRRPSVDDGAPVYVKLIIAGESCTDPESGDYTASAKVKHGEARFKIEGVREGSYTACAFLDLVKREGPPSFDSGDLGATKDVEVTGDTTFEIGEDEWTPLP
jgi:hypothetical protein